MLPLLPAILSFAPQIAKMITGDNESKVVDKAVDVIKTLTGIGNAEEAVQAVQASPELQLQFNQTWTVAAVELYKTEVEDRKDGRRMYESILASGAFNIVNVLALLNTAGFFGVVFFLLTKGMPGENNQIAWFIIGAICAKATTTDNFFFGSSVGSKTKDIMQAFKGKNNG